MCPTAWVNKDLENYSNKKKPLKMRSSKTIRKVVQSDSQGRSPTMFMDITKKLEIT
jgi:hypothetical protein